MHNEGTAEADRHRAPPQTQAQSGCVDGDVQDEHEEKKIRVWKTHVLKSASVSLMLGTPAARGAPGAGSAGA